MSTTAVLAMDTDISKKKEPWVKLWADDQIKTLPVFSPEEFNEKMEELVLIFQMWKI